MHGELLKRFEDRGEIADFHVLHSRLVFRCQIVARTGLRVGAGAGGDQDATDLPVMRDVDGFPFIPGSSLKGALRSTIEALVRAGGFCHESGLWACDPLIEAPPEKDGACGWHKSGSRAKANFERHCALCRLFGSRLLASHVRFCDAHVAVSDAYRTTRRVPIEVRDGVAIDRELKVAFGGQKYDFEVVSPGTRFDLEVFVENPVDWLMGLLVMGFDQLRDGFTALGGFTSRGLGRVDLVWDKLELVTSKGLLAGDGPTAYTDAEREALFSSWRGKLAEKVNGLGA